MRKLFQLTLLVLIGLALSGCSTVNLGVAHQRYVHAALTEG
jgi:hypothetical protein